MGIFKRKQADLQVEAVDTSGVIRRCPFCGSGQVLQRSDGTTHCDFCFAGETEYVTWDGVRTLKETAGTTQRVLSSARSREGDHSTFGGVWVDAEIRSFGVQPLHRVTMTRGGILKEVHATSEHRWLIHPRRGSAANYKRKAVRLTAELGVGDRLVSLLPGDRIRKKQPTVPSSFGIAHGFVFGDGTLDGRGGSKVVLWGDKDRAVLPHFTASRQRPVTNESGASGIEVKDLPSFFKTMAPAAESLSYLYGWLAGYFAADGSVTSTGSAHLDCVDRETLERVKDYCLRLGIGSYSIRPYQRLGLGQTEPGTMWRMPLMGQCLTPDFFLVPEHRERFEGRKSVDREPDGWTVLSVEETSRVEEVFCAVVPDGHNFTLADDINVMNCDTAFTVTMMPNMPAMPTYVNGQDAPNDNNMGPEEIGAEQMDPMDPTSMMGPATGDAFVPPEGSQEGGPGVGAPGGAPGAGGQPFVPPEGSQDGQPGIQQAAASLHTASGDMLGADDYLRHLAIAAAPPERRTLVIAAVRDSRASSAIPRMK